MNCKVVKNRKNNKINNVLNQSGEKSVLFQQIFNIPTLNLDETLNIYKNVYADKIQSKVMFQIVGEQGASQIEQYQKSLNQAKELDEQGESASEVEKQTGWYKFKGQWRKLSPEVIKSFEIRNNTKDEVLTLKEVLDEGNKIFEFYPELNNTKVVFVGKGIQGMEMPENFENGYGAYDEASRTILINTVSQGNVVGDKEQKYTLGHELQHVIQQVEKQPKGGNRHSILDEAMELLSIKSERLSDIYSEIENADKSKLTENEKLIVDASLQTILAIANKDFKFLNNQYKHLLGEIDANVVEGLLKIKDNQNIIATNYSEMLSNHAQFFNIDLNNVFLLKNGNVKFSINDERISQTEEQGSTKAGRIAIEAEANLRGGESTNSKDTFTEPKATFNGFNSYTEAVKNTPINDIIKIDIEGINVAEITNNGDINDLIRQDIILDQRELAPSGDIVFKTVGNSLAKKLVNAEIAREIVKGRVNEEGNIIAREKVELTEVSTDFNKNKKQFGQDIALTILGTQILANNTPTFGNNRIIDYSIEVPSDNILMTKLKNLLQELGVKTMSLESWSENYKTRTGELPTSNALADVTNKIIAFANGEITQDALTEETIHFVTFALPQEQIQPLLDMIHKTDEWKQYAEQYTEIYKGDDFLVRKEVLDKMLKNYVQKQQEQPTLQGQSITRRLVELLDKFFAQIRGLFKPQHQAQLEKFAEEFYQKLMAEELYSELSPEQFDGNTLVMYQAAPSTIYDHLTKTVESFDSLDRKTGRQNKFELSLLDIENRDELNQLRTTAALSALIKTKIKHLTKRGKQGGFLSVEEQLVYDVAINELAPALGELKNIIAENVITNKTLKQKVLDEVTQTITSLSELTTALNEDNKRVFDTLVEDVAVQTGLTPEMTEILKNEIKTLQRDTNQFFALYGSLSHAQSPILNILSTVISDAEREAVIQYDRRQSEFINSAKALGFKEEEIADELKKFKDGYYFISQWDFEAMEKERAIFKAEAYNELTGQNKTADDILKDELKLIKKLSQKQQNTYNFKVKEKVDKSGMQLDRLTAEERKKADELIAGFSEKTRRFLSDQAKRKSEVMQRIKENKGASAEDNSILKELAKQRQQMSNPYDESGILHKGIVMDKDGEITKSPSDDSLEELDKEIATTILELNEYNKKIVAQYKERERLEGKQVVPQSFIDKIQELRGSGDFEGINKASDFLMMNTRISYNNNFWDLFEKTNGLVDKLRESSDPKALTIADEIEHSRIRLKNILKEHRDYNNPSQIDFENLEGAESVIKDISSDLEHSYEKAKAYVKDEETIKKVTNSESITNKAYEDVTNDRGISIVKDRKSYEEKLDFILRHVTPNNRGKILRTSENFIRYKKGAYDKVPKSFERFHNESVDVEEFIGDDSGEDVKIYNDIISYAESMLLPYFKELKPSNFDMRVFIANLVKSTTEEEFNRVIEETKYLSVTPSYVLIDSEDNKRLNPKYTEAYEAGEPTVNLDYKGGVLKSKKYQEMFAPDSNGNATKNVKQKQLLDLTVNFWADSIDSASMMDNFSKFQLPGIRRGSIARKEQIIKNINIKSLKNFTNIKESIKDNITVREDELIFGQAADLSTRGALQIPRIGFSKLETAEEVTDELLYSLMHTANQAEKRKQRISILHKIEAVKTRLKGATYGDKSGEATTAYKMADDFIRYNIYGQTETFKWETDFLGLSSKKVNLTPTVKYFQSYARLVGIGFSALVPFTSFLQGSTNFLAENIVGDRINKTASRLAARKAGQLVSRATREEFMSDLKTKSELNLLMQFFGLENPVDKFRNSNYGRTLRGLTLENSAYFSHFMGDIPLTAQTLMTVLYDFKIVEDVATKEKKLQSYSEWRNENRALRIAESQKPATEKEALSEWKLNDKYLYNYIEIKKDKNRQIVGMQMNAEYEKAFVGKEKYAADRLNFVKRKIMVVKQEIDNQIPNEDKSYIQRHAIWSFVSMFKGFLITSVNKRLKTRHRSMQTNQLEEGTYKGTAEFLGALINSGRKGSFKDFWKEQYKDFDGGYKLETEGTKESPEYAIYDTSKDGAPELLRTKDKKLADNTYAQLKVQATQMRQVSLKRASLDFAVTTSLAVIALLLKQIADDDKDENWLKEFTAYMGYRVAVETTSQSLGLPGQLYSFLQSPTAGLSLVNNFMNIGDLFSGKMVNRGTYRDYSEREALLYRSIPVMKEYFRLKEIDRSRQDYKRYNKHFIDNFNFAALIFDEESRK